MFISSEPPFRKFFIEHVPSSAITKIHLVTFKFVLVHGLDKLFILLSVQLTRGELTLLKGLMCLSELNNRMVSFSINIAPVLFLIHAQSCELLSCVLIIF